jgi:hypothetical protein
MERFTTSLEAARIKTATDWVTTAIFTLWYFFFCLYRGSSYIFAQQNIVQGPVILSRR